jgi:hypothetical protein
MSSVCDAVAGARFMSARFMSAADTSCMSVCSCVCGFSCLSKAVRCNKFVHLLPRSVTHAVVRMLCYDSTDAVVQCISPMLSDAFARCQSMLFALSMNIASTPSSLSALPVHADCISLLVTDGLCPMFPRWLAVPRPLSAPSCNI